MRARVLVFLFLSVFSETAFASRGEAAILKDGKAVIYYSESCHGCRDYIDGTVIPLLKEWGTQEIIEKDYLNEPANRKELFEVKQRLGVPVQLQGHITTILDESIILEGHVPQGMIKELLSQRNKGRYECILVYQDEMKKPTHYQVWPGRGEPKTFSIDVPLSKALDDLDHTASTKVGGSKILLSTVMATGFLDGINPCAFAVLLFFIAFLFTIKKTRQNIFRMGITYIVAIYFTYFLIGLGLFKAFSISNSPHLMAKVGASLVILLGTIQIKDYFFPNLPLSLRVPRLGEKMIVNWAYKATFPAAFILGALVGLCTFPCSGGIYVATISLLQSKTTLYKGLAYLTLYNLMFVLPLLFILTTASSKVIAGKLLHWERVWKGKMHLLSGTTMIGVGIAILTWFV